MILNKFNKTNLYIYLPICDMYIYKKKQLLFYSFTQSFLVKKFNNLQKG